MSSLTKSSKNSYVELFRKVFHECDLNQDGNVSKADLVGALRQNTFVQDFFKQCGPDAREIAEDPSNAAGLLQLYYQLDRDNNKAVTERDFLVYAISHYAPPEFTQPATSTRSTTLNTVTPSAPGERLLAPRGFSFVIPSYLAGMRRPVADASTRPTALNIAQAYGLLASTPGLLFPSQHAPPSRVTTPIESNEMTAADIVPLRPLPAITQSVDPQDRSAVPTTSRSLSHLPTSASTPQLTQLAAASERNSVASPVKPSPSASPAPSPPSGTITPRLEAAKQAVAAVDYVSDLLESPDPSSTKSPLGFDLDNDPETHSTGVASHTPVVPSQLETKSNRDKRNAKSLFGDQCSVITEENENMPENEFTPSETSDVDSMSSDRTETAAEKGVRKELSQLSLKVTSVDSPDLVRMQLTPVPQHTTIHSLSPMARDTYSKKIHRVASSSALHSASGPASASYSHSHGEFQEDWRPSLAFFERQARLGHFAIRAIVNLTTDTESGAEHTLAQHPLAITYVRCPIQDYTAPLQGMLNRVVNIIVSYWNVTVDVRTLLGIPLTSPNSMVLSDSRSKTDDNTMGVSPQDPELNDSELDFEFDEHGDIYLCNGKAPQDTDASQSTANDTKSAESKQASTVSSDASMITPSLIRSTSAGLSGTDHSSGGEIYNSNKQLAKTSPFYVRMILRLLTPPVGVHFLADVHVATDTHNRFSLGAESRFGSHIHSSIPQTGHADKLEASTACAEPSSCEACHLYCEREQKKDGMGNSNGADNHPLARVPAAVVVHCAAGVGRTGCIIACCMLKIAHCVLEAIQVTLRGIQNGDGMTTSSTLVRRKRLENCARLLHEFDWRRAISVLRLLRPGSVETPSQERAIRIYYERLYPSESTMSKNEVDAELDAKAASLIRVHSVPRAVQLENRHSYFHAEQPLARLPFEWNGLE